MDEDLSRKESKRQMQRFENCLGKHSDSLEQALSILSGHMKQTSEVAKVTYDHEGEVNALPGTRPVLEVHDRGDQYLLS